MSMPYEILCRGEGGKFKGAHVIDLPGGAARPIRAEDWPKIASSINTDTLSQLLNLTTQLEALTLQLAEDAVKANEDLEQAQKSSADALAQVNTDLLAAQATLVEHQRISDEAVRQAGPAIERLAATGADVTELVAILSSAATGPEARAKAVIQAEYEAVRQKAIDAGVITE